MKDKTTRRGRALQALSPDPNPGPERRSALRPQQIKRNIVSSMVEAQGHGRSVRLLERRRKAEAESGFPASRTPPHPAQPRPAHSSEKRKSHGERPGEPRGFPRPDRPHPTHMSEHDRSHRASPGEPRRPPHTARRSPAHSSEDDKGRHASLDEPRGLPGPARPCSAPSSEIGKSRRARPGPVSARLPPGRSGLGPFRTGASQPGCFHPG